MHTSVKEAGAALEKDLGSIHTELQDLEHLSRDAGEELWRSSMPAASQVVPTYQHPGKNFRLKRGAGPRWYKARAGVRTHVQSGAAPVARFKPKR